MFLRGLVRAGRGSIRRLWNGHPMKEVSKVSMDTVTKDTVNSESTPATTTATNVLNSSTRMDRSLKPIVWIDCEMTGLDHKNDQIIEVCCIITDGNLNVLDKDPSGNNCYESVIHCDKSVMDSMNEWCIEHHGASGLTEKVIKSEKSKEQVENELLEYIKKFIPDRNVGILAGNSIHMDRLFMLKDFPKVIDHLFYRLIDVSTIMEVSRRHNPSLASVVPKKETAHTAKKDILESIAQLEWYTQHYLKNETETSEFVSQRKQEMEAEEPQSNKRSFDQVDDSNEESELKKNKK